MKLYKILPALVVLVLILAGCGKDKTKEGPWKGYWFGNVTNETGDNAINFYLRLDLYGSTVCAGGFENALGVLSISKDRTRFTPLTSDVVTGARIISDTVAEIEYVQQSSGQLWSGTFTYNPKTHRLSFKNGKMLRPGPSGSTEPVELPYEVSPEGREFDFVSEKPNYKEIRSYEMIMELPDRTYYLKCLADEVEAPPYGDVQLRCYFPETDRDILIANEVGESPLSARFRATIIDCWELPDQPGIGVIVWRGGPTDQEFTLFRVDDTDTFREIDYVSGLRPARFNDAPIDSTKMCFMSREGRVIKVFDPINQETRLYDKSCMRK
ncbi:MAG: hypothetical protein K2M12_01095 [Muribaculaceae bacterium]|nr:hypothetical protein [Muribaculaceae bacterium]